MNYVCHMLVMISIYAMLGGSLNLVAGYTGLPSMCHAAFYGLGAYSTTLLMMSAGLGFFSALGVALIVTALLSIAIALPALRLKGDYFVLATLGFQIIVVALFYNLTNFTGGPNGIPGIPIPRLFGFEFDSVFRYLVLSSVVSATGLFVLWLLINSPFGRLLRAIREDEVASASLGKNVPRVQSLAFAISAAMAAVPGALFAGYIRYIDPTTFTVMESIFILSIVVIGGAGSFWGPVVGAAFMVILPEALRFLELPLAAAANVRQITYGLLLVILMRFRPQGLLGEYKFE
jgi:branched-chain amino acid transport system permease protein